MKSIKNKVYTQVRNQVWDQVRDQLNYQVRHKVWDQVYWKLREQVLDQVYIQVLDQVWIQHSNQVYEQLKEDLDDIRTLDPLKQLIDEQIIQDNNKKSMYNLCTNSIQKMYNKIFKVLKYIFNML